LTEPYLVPPPGEHASYTGTSMFSNDDVYRMVAACFARGVQLLVHAEGDAAAEQMIEAVARAERRYGRADRRPVMAHAQTVRDDQLDRMRALGIVPSFFATQCFFWGDWYVASVLGTERANRINPACAA